MCLKDRVFLIVMAGVTALGLCARVGAAQEIAKLLASDRETDDDFGLSVAVSGDCVLVGAPGEDASGVGDAGAAYIFRFDGTDWVEEAKLTASDGGLGHSFGNSVAISGNYALVGAVGGSTGATQNTGAVYVFYYNEANWSQQAKLTASDAIAGASFGGTVSIRGNHVVAGAWSDASKGSNAGAAYLFTRVQNSWVEQARLEPGGLDTDDHFGIRVSIDDDYVIIGANGDDDKGSNSGAAYIFSLE